MNCLGGKNIFPFGLPLCAHFLYMSVYQKALDDPWLRMDIFGGFDWLKVLNLPASSYDKYQ